MASGQLKELTDSPDELDHILAAMAFGEDRVTLSEPELQRLRDAELALELLEEHNGNKRLVVAALMSRGGKPLSRTRAYEACTDAQHLFGYITSFDYSFELLLKKNRLELAIRKTAAAGEWKQNAVLEKEHTAVLEYLRLENERRRPDDPKVLNWILHNDYTKIGWEPEDWEAANKRLDEVIIPAVLRGYKGDTANVPK